jgi:Protein of unknown function, DUF547
MILRRDLRHKFTVHRNSFRGSDLVDALVREFGLRRRGEAVEFAKTLHRDHHVVCRVVSGSSSSNSDNNKGRRRRRQQDDVVDDDFTRDLYFRLQCDQSPAVLNSYRVWTERVDPDPMALLKRLKGLLNAILADHTNERDGTVNYRAAAMHRDFPAFEEATCELQGVDYENMPYGRKLAFSLNLYNLMIKYAFTKVGIGATDLARNAFFNTVAIQMGGGSSSSSSPPGGYVLTFQDLENGVLRGNRRAPYALSRQFGSGDDRLKLIMPKVDNRIHFGLNCGATSCPPVKNFTEEGIEEELRIVAQAFCEDDGNVRIRDGTLFLNKIFSWYIEDFGGNATESAKTVLTFLRGDKARALEGLMATGSLTVRYNHYDWGTDASDFVPFAGSAVKADATRFLL